jgi:hypothetical protein
MTDEEMIEYCKDKTIQVESDKWSLYRCHSKTGVTINGQYFNRQTNKDAFASLHRLLETIEERAETMGALDTLEIVFEAKQVTVNVSAESDIGEEGVCFDE